VPCKQINILHSLFMNAGPSHVAFGIMSTLHVAAHWINQEQYLLPGYELVLHTRDTAWSATTKDIIIAEELLNSSAEFKYAGSISSFNLDGGFVYLMDKLKLPLMTGSVSQQMANPDLMPGVLSTVNSAEHADPAIKKVLEKCGFSGIGIIHDAQFAYEANLFHQDIVAAGYHVDFFSELNEVSQIGGVVKNIKETRTRVLLVLAETGAMVWLTCAFHLEKMRRILVLNWPSMPWFFSAAVAQDPTCYNPNVLLGVVEHNYIGWKPLQTWSH